MTDTTTQVRADALAGLTSPQSAPQLPAVQQEPRPVKTLPPRLEYPGKIAKAILNIQRQIGSIQKEGFNEFQRYKYTRWEDICEKLSPLLAEHGLIIVQSEQTRSLLEENDKGSVLAIVYHFTLVSETGDQWPAVEWTAIARLRDQKGVTDDKAAAKCHTQAEKQFAIKQFKIHSDSDIEDEDRSATLPKKDAGTIYRALQKECDDGTSVIGFQSWMRDANTIARVRVMPLDWQSTFRLRCAEKLADLKAHQETVEWHDDETGELDNPPRTGQATADAPAPTHPQPRGAGAPTESERVAHWDSVLATAAAISLYACDAAWSNVPAELKPALQAAYERRHRPGAKVAGKPK